MTKSTKTIIIAAAITMLSSFPLYSASIEEYKGKDDSIIIAAAITMLSSFPLYSASIEEFQTEEYYGSGGLDLINAAEAYSKGYTGKGVTIGINDLPVNFDHEAFSGKTGSKYIGSFELNGIDWKTYGHGTLIGGIAAGNKNDKEMHGVAFDADIISTFFLSEDLDFPKYDSYSEIKCINNSWGADFSIDKAFNINTPGYEFTKEEVFSAINDYIYNYYGYIVKQLNEGSIKDKLSIFANGSGNSVLISSQES